MYGIGVHNMVLGYIYMHIPKYESEK